MIRSLECLKLSVENNVFQNRILPRNHFKRSKVSLRKSSTSLGRRTSRVHRRRVRFTRRGQLDNFHGKMSTSMGLKPAKHADSQGRYIICIYIYINIPRAPMTSIFEGQPFKTRPFPIKTTVIWVPVSRYIVSCFLHVRCFFNIISIGCGTIINHDF